MDTFNSAVFFQLGFYIALLVFTIHAIILSYHWITYGAKKGQSMLSLAVYLCGGAFFLLSLSISLSFI